MSMRPVESTATGNGEELVQFSPPGFGVSTSVLPPAEVEQHDEDPNDENRRDPPTKAGPIELQPRCPRRLIDDIVVVLLLLSGRLVWFAFSSAHFFVADLVARPGGLAVSAPESVANKLSIAGLDSLGEDLLDRD